MQVSEDTKRIWTIPNILSVFRIVLVPLYVIVYFRNTEGGSIAAGVVLIVSGLTDLFDGYIARRFNQISDLGKILDPLADKMTQVTVFVCLWIRFPALWPLFVFIAFKELLMLSVGLAMTRRGVIFTSLWYGKVTTFAIYCAVSAFTIFPNQLEGRPMTLIATVLLAMLAFALCGYGSVFLRTVGRRELKDKGLLREENGQRKHPSYVTFLNKE